MKEGNAPASPRLVLVAGIGVYIIAASFAAFILLNFLLFPLVAIIQLPFPTVDDSVLANIHRILILAIGSLIVGVSAELIWRHYRSDVGSHQRKVLFSGLALLMLLVLEYWL